MSRQADRPLAVERHRAIEELLRRRGTIRAAELAALFGVTPETIRRDLNELAERGVIQRAHGGAVAAVSAETSFDYRLGVREAEKLAIAVAAAELVEDGMRILLDSGTTTLGLARALREKRGLVVVTNALTHAMELLRNPDATVILAGGIVRRSTFGGVGDLAVDAIRQLRVDRTFLAIHSVSARGGLTYPSFKEVAVKRAMIDAGGDVSLLADSSKIGRSSLVQVAPITAVQRIVTAGAVDADEAQAIREQGVEIVVAPPAP